MTEKKKILIVEDDDINMFILESLLKKEFVLTKAKNAGEALKLAEENKFDAVLMDINLGNESIDGIEAMKRIRDMEKNVDTQIFAVTSYALPEDRKRFLDEGFDAYFPKPLLKEDLIRELNKISF
ncbi:MAG TPA: response regulator [Cytophagaceae bacterium]|jgi:CheY-like chemotaxis protein|nr:response regulator [Cytophagaceae bacterium]